MLLSQVFTDLKNLTNVKITQEDLGKILGVTRSAINQRIKNNSEVTLSELKVLEKTFKINLQDVSKQNINIGEFTAKLFPDVIGSCGNGVFEQSQNYEMITLPQKLVSNKKKKKTYSIITAYGDSMAPAIQDKDKLIIEHINNNVITDNRVYVFCFDNQIYVKRLVKNIDEIVVVSDNPDKTIYKTKTINNANIDNFFLIGQVVGLYRNLSKV